MFIILAGQLVVVAAWLKQTLSQVKPLAGTPAVEQLVWARSVAAGQDGQVLCV